MNETISLRAADHDFRVRVYAAPEPNGTALVWLHGGAFMFGSLDMPEADAVAARLAASRNQRGLRRLHARAPSSSTSSATTTWTACPRAKRFSPRPKRRVHAPRSLSRRCRPSPPSTGPSHTQRSSGPSPAGSRSAAASAGGNLATGATLRLRDRRREDAAAATPSALVLAYPVLHSELPRADESLLSALEGLPRRSPSRLRPPPRSMPTTWRAPRLTTRTPSRPRATFATSRRRSSSPQSVIGCGRLPRRSRPI